MRKKVVKKMLKTARDVRNVLIDSKITSSIGDLDSLQLFLLYELTDHLVKKLSSDPSESGLSQEELEVIDCYYGTSFSTEARVCHIQMTGSEISFKLGKPANTIRQKAIKKLQKLAEGTDISARVRVITMPKESMAEKLSAYIKASETRKSRLAKAEEERRNILKALDKEIKETSDAAKLEKLQHRRFRVNRHFDSILAEEESRREEGELIKSISRLRTDFFMDMKEVLP